MSPLDKIACKIWSVGFGIGHSTPNHEAVKGYTIKFKSDNWLWLIFISNLLANPKLLRNDKWYSEYNGITSRSDKPSFYKMLTVTTGDTKCLRDV